MAGEGECGDYGDGSCLRRNEPRERVRLDSVMSLLGLGFRVPTKELWPECFSSHEPSAREFETVCSYPQAWQA